MKKMREMLASFSIKTPAETLFPDLDSLLDYIGPIPTYPRRKNKTTHYYYNIPMAFDIETTSTYIGEGKQRHKAGIMYLWSFCINGGVIQGRTWDQWVQVCKRLSERLSLDATTHAIIYIRNMEFEFQFMRKWFEWTQVFAINNRRPVYGITSLGIEFRCSYILSGESLETSGKKLKTYKVQKLVGDLDYTLPRHTQTILTDKERDYAINDVRVDVSYIQEKMDDVDGLITRLQLTKTGYVRKYCRDACMYTGSHKKHGWKALAYQQRMSRLVIDPVDEYPALKRAFQGGFTHASARFSGTTQKDVDSWDLTSSYPAVMIGYKFPMSTGELVQIKTKDEFYRNIRLYACVFDVEFNGLVIRDNAPDCPISKSKCYHIKGRCIENNGRIALCDHLVTTITDVDFQVYKQYYTWKSMRIGHFWRYRRGYLPTELVDAILTLYEKKTTLKGVEGREQEYMQSKENINSCYGMIVTDICRDENKYEGNEWLEPKHADICEEIEKYNKDKRRFLFYVWGLFTTALARMRLFSAIWHIGESGYYYSDTDSVKILHGDRYKEYFEHANEDITKRIEKALKWHRIDPKRACPLTINGSPKPLGVWDYEGRYKRFKALRAKAYMTETDDGINITVSGVNKKAAVPYLIKKYKDPFEHFDSGLSIPAGYTGKLTHTYIDDEQAGVLTDYNGVTAEWYEKSAIHMESASYDMELTLQYLDYLKGYREVMVHG